MTPAATPDNLRYPIGRPDLVATATPEQRTQWIADLDRKSVV